MIQLREEFVIEAYKAACEDWKKKILVEVPDLFKFSMRKVEELESHISYRVASNHFGRVTESGDGRLLIDLPSANAGWTISAWRLAEDICNRFQFYPIHDDRAVLKKITLIPIKH